MNNTHLLLTVYFVGNLIHTCWSEHQDPWLWNNQLSQTESKYPTQENNDPHKDTLSRMQTLHSATNESTIPERIIFLESISLPLMRHAGLGPVT